MSIISPRLLISLTALTLVLNGSLGWAASPTVSNVRASQRAQSQLVDVFYDLSATNSGPFTVSIAVSTNSGVTYDLPASSFTGNGIGSAVSLGTRKQVVWNAGVDWPGKYSSAIRFRVTAVENTAPSGMVLIPAGTNTGTDPDFGAYSLTVSAFYMDKYLVTKAKWDEVYNWAIMNGYSFTNAGSGKAFDHPVHAVNWYDCVKWCNARSEKEGKPVSYRVGSNVYRTGQDKAVTCDLNVAGYRLPTDVEFQYAARGGVSNKRFPWGDTIDHNKANYYGYPSGYSYDLGYAGYDTNYISGGYPYTSPVGAFEAGKNGYGLYDMAGNLWEWCWDWYPGYEGSHRVLRGGSWGSYANGCRVGIRSNDGPGRANYSIGFRVALPPGQ